MSSQITDNPLLKSETVNNENPWPGLLAYREADRAFFHGRQTESGQLLRLVMREPLTVLFGLSGLGKSSLIQAGLFPLLRQRNILPAYVRLVFSDGHRDLAEQTLKALFVATERAGAEAPKIEPSHSLWSFFHLKDADFWSRSNRLLMPLLVFDQFEELFTLGRADKAEAEEERQAEIERYQGEIREQERVKRLEERADSAIRLRRRFFIAVTMAILTMAMGGVALLQWNTAVTERERAIAASEIAKENREVAVTAKEEAQTARAEAERQRDLADARLQKIMDSIALRQAIMTDHIDVERDPSLMRFDMCELLDW